MADYQNALGSLMTLLSEHDVGSGDGTEEQADWYWLDRSEVRFGSKAGPRPYLLFQGDYLGDLSVYPRTTLKGESPKGNHFPDQQYPKGVLHRAHTHPSGRCSLHFDATVLAYKPRPLPEYIIRRRKPGCVEDNHPWLRYFRGALDAIAYEESSPGSAVG